MSKEENIIYSVLQTHLDAVTKDSIMMTEGPFAYARAALWNPFVSIVCATQ